MMTLFAFVGKNIRIGRELDVGGGNVLMVIELIVVLIVTIPSIRFELLIGREV